MRSQIYIGFMNWFLLFFVLLIMLIFKESHNLASAYGLAVTGSMSITGTMMTVIFYLRKKYFLSFIALSVTFVDIIYLVSNTYKIPHGGYWSIIIALIPFSIIMLYTLGQKRLYKSLELMSLRDFLDSYNEVYPKSYRIRGTALYFAKDIRKIPPYITRTMLTNNIIYEDNIIVSIIQKDEPFGIESSFKENITEGMRRFVIKAGYMEVVDVEKILKKSGVDEKVIFYGIEEIVTENVFWKIFAMIKSLTPSFVQFYKLPSNKLHGIITRIEM